MTATLVAADRSAHVTPQSAAGNLARSKVMALRFIAHLSALSAERRARLADRLDDAEPVVSRDAARAHVRAAVADPDVIGRDVDRAAMETFLASLDYLMRDASAGDTALAGRADDVVRALLVHTHPAYRADFHTLYAPFQPDIGYDRLLLG